MAKKKVSANAKEVAGRLLLAEIENIIEEWDGTYGDVDLDDKTVAKVKKSLQKKADKLAAKFGDTQEVEETEETEGDEE